MYSILRNALVISKISFRNLPKRFRRRAAACCSRPLAKLFQLTISSPTRIESSAKCNRPITIIRSKRRRLHYLISPCRMPTVKSIKSPMKSTQSHSTGRVFELRALVSPARRRSVRRWRRRTVIAVARYSVIDVSTNHYPCQAIRVANPCRCVGAASKCYRKLARNTFSFLLYEYCLNFHKTHTVYYYEILFIRHDVWIHLTVID